MAQIRSSSEGLGLFATRKISKGDLIFEEEPMCSLFSMHDKKILNLKSNFDTKITSKRESMIKVSEGYTRHVLMKKMDNEVDGFIKVLLSLYHPDLNSPLESEEEIVSLARDVLKEFINDSSIYNQLNVKNEYINEEELLKIMLVWSCNAFEGGLIYPKLSRVNHSCNPNAIYLTTDDEMNKNTTSNQIKLRACSTIEDGEEICISYLGILTWAGVEQRKSNLKRDKHFFCQCNRCQKENSNELGDLASGIPCLKCHPRLNDHRLNEEISWGEVEVHYVFPYTDKSDNICYKCNTCQSTFTSSQYIRLFHIMENVSGKVLERITSKPFNIVGYAKSDQTNENEASLISVETEIDEQLYEMSSSIFGLKHWYTNFMLMAIITRTLTDINSGMILRGEPPDLEMLAEAIDSFETVWGFAVSLQLKIPTCALLLKPTIGIARCLVSFRDDKSKAYAMQFIEKMDEYVTLFLKHSAIFKVMEGLVRAARKRTIQDEESIENDRNYQSDITNNKQLKTVKI